MSSTQQLLLTEGGGAAPNYIEEVFSTYLYTGTSTADNKITNNIDLATKSGMVWLKSRTGATNNYLTTNATTTSSSGGTTWLYSNTTDALLGATGTGLCNFFTDGFDINPTGTGVNDSANNYASWTFRKQPKFFDIVTYTGTGSSRTVAHNLGSTPGSIIVKRTSGVENWTVYHQSQGANKVGFLNLTNAFGTNNTIWGNTSPTSTVFTVGDADAGTNANGSTYVAYIFAHDAGGFGLTGTDNVISCGSFTTGATGIATINLNLGWEAQWICFKPSSKVGDWTILDTMCGMAYSGGKGLYPNLSSAESDFGSSAYPIVPTATGLSINEGYLSSSATYIYIAIRRGPMKVPTDATKVFAPVATTAASGTVITTNFPVDLQFQRKQYTLNATYTMKAIDRLRGVSSTSTESGPYLQTSATTAETAGSTTLLMNNTGYQVSSYNNGDAQIYWNFRRAPSFFDEVCYTGTGAVGLEVKHNLGVAPELVIWKARNNTYPWPVQTASMGWKTNAMYLNTTAAKNADYYMTADPTATSMFLRSENNVNSSYNYVAYLFATCAGVSKVGTYTGNGSTQAIACGFAGGARFVLIKRTDAVGAWYVYDTARGMTTLTDPYLLLNSTAAEAATLGSVTTTTGGFTVNAAILSAINTNAASYVFFAVA